MLVAADDATLAHTQQTEIFQWNLVVPSWFVQTDGSKLSDEVKKCV